MGSLVSIQLKTQRKDAGLSVKEVVSKLSIYGINISEKTYYGWENGARTPDADEFIALCQIYGVSSIAELNNPATLTREERDLLSSYSKLDTWARNTVRAVITEELKRCTAPEPEDDTLIMLFSQNKASAGTGWELGEDSTERWTVLLNELTRKADFCVMVDGDSMEPRYYNGDIILVRKQPSIDLGEIGLYTFDGHGYVKKQGNNCLISLNTKYPNITPEQYAGITCIGLVLGKLEPEWIRSK